MLQKIRKLFIRLLEKLLTKIEKFFINKPKKTFNFFCVKKKKRVSINIWQFIQNIHVNNSRILYISICWIYKNDLTFPWNQETRSSKMSQSLEIFLKSLINLLFSRLFHFKRNRERHLREEKGTFFPFTVIDAGN